MLHKENYRFCVKTGLQIMREQREKMLHDVLCSEPTIYSGLHTPDSASLRSLYFESYLTEWISSHWEQMYAIFERHTELSRDIQKEMTLFFASYFAELLDSYASSGSMADVAMPILLKAQKEQLRELIHTSVHWEENSNRIRVQIKKGKEQFARLIQEMEADI